jgi:hypothetical protein
VQPDPAATALPRGKDPGLGLGFGRGGVLPGRYRRPKAWDLLVLQRGTPILAVECWSVPGSVRNNPSNRADEVPGIAEDARQAGLRGVLPPNLHLACIRLLEATPATQVPVWSGRPASSAARSGSPSRRRPSAGTGSPLGPGSAAACGQAPTELPLAIVMPAR